MPKYTLKKERKGVSIVTTLDMKETEAKIAESKATIDDIQSRKTEIDMLICKLEAEQKQLDKDLEFILFFIKGVERNGR